MRLLKLVPDDTNIDFLKWRNVAMMISILMIIASIALVAVRGLNFGIDFLGGQSIRVEFSKAPPIDEVREYVDTLGYGEATIQQMGSPKILSIRTGLPEGDANATDQAGDALKSVIRQHYPDAKFGSVSTVSGKVSGELVKSGGLSLALAMIAISIYIWFRFEWQFGVGALFSLIHDVALTFGFFALTQMEFNLSIVAALLTIIGYSLNDTIVVYDRVRENLKKYRKMDMIALLNLSVNETLSRTIMTSVFMIITLGILLIFGPEVIFGFTAAMLLGIFIGTYSSIYIACSILVFLKVGPESFIASEGGAAQGAERVGPRPARNSDGAVV